MHEHSVEGRDGASQTDVTAAPATDAPRLSPAAALRGAWLLQLQATVGNRAVARLMRASPAAPTDPRRRLQRRTAEPIRSDAGRTFTYPLKLYTVDAESYAQAQEAADKLNAVTRTVFDFQTQADFTVRFAVAVFAPPEPDVLERAFGTALHYRAGRHRLRGHRYQEAAQRWWLQFLRQEGNTGNLFLGHNNPSEETKSFIRELAAAQARATRAEVTREYRSRLAAANSAGAREDAKQYFRTEMSRLDSNDPEEVVQGRLDHPLTGSRGTTFSHAVVKLSGLGGTPEYRQSIQVHEFMHLLGLDVDHTDYRRSVMSYPYLQQNPEQVVMPQQDDVEALVDHYNAPPSTSID